METSKKNNVVLLSSVAAAAAGIAVVVAIVRWRRQSLTVARMPGQLRNVQDVLTDCYKKIREIEEHIPAFITTSVPISRQQQTSQNGHPAFDS